MKFFGIFVAALLATSAYAIPSPCGDGECPNIVVVVPAATTTVTVEPIVTVVPCSSGIPASLVPAPSSAPVPCHACEGGSTTTSTIAPGAAATSLPKFVSGADRAVIAKGALCAVVVGVAGLLL